MVKFVQGDMFEGSYDILVNTVNCVGVMGAGVALAFKSRYPEMFRVYKKACDEGRIRPGEIDVWRDLTDWLINFPTKRHWRAKSRYEDIDAGLDSLREYLKLQGQVRVALPALGCGHGGLDWTRVASMIEAKLHDLDAEIFVFKPDDSRAAGEKVQASKRRRASEKGLDWHTLVPAAEYFPQGLQKAGIKQVTVFGKDALLGQKCIAVISSSKPDAREEDSAMACVKALAGAGVTLSFSFGRKLSHAMATTCLERGAHVILWAAEGGARVRIPIKFHEYIRRGRLTVLTVAATNEGWAKRNAMRTALLRVSMASAILLTSPSWPPYWNEKAPDPPVFFVWYGQERKQLCGIGARRIGRVRESGKPNISPILNSLFSGDRELTRQTSSIS